MQVEFSAMSRGARVWLSQAIAVFAVLSVSLASVPASAATLDQIKATGHIKFGYFADARALHTAGRQRRASMATRPRSAS